MFAGPTVPISALKVAFLPTDLHLKIFCMVQNVECKSWANILVVSNQGVGGKYCAWVSEFVKKKFSNTEWVSEFKSCS